MGLEESRLEQTEIEELPGASELSLIAFTLLLLRTLGAVLSSGEFELELALAAIVFFRQVALLSAACDRMALRRGPF